MDGGDQKLFLVFELFLGGPSLFLIAGRVTLTVVP